MPRLVRRLLALVLGLAAAAAGAELTLRACGPAEAFRLWTPGLRAEFAPRAEIMPGTSGLGTAGVAARRPLASSTG